MLDCAQARTRFLPRSARSATVALEAVMQGPVLCNVCGKAESDCNCEKYCTICQGQTGIRLCVDGLYYCPDCREACDVSLADDRGH